MVLVEPLSEMGLDIGIAGVYPQTSLCCSDGLAVEIQLDLQLIEELQL